MTERPLHLALLALYSIALLGCPATPGESPQTAAITATPAPPTGIPKALPRRIVSLAPNVTEALFALNCQERLVGATRHCTYPDQAKLLPRIGDYVNPSLELVLTREPDLVVTPAEGTVLPLVRKLQSLGIPVHVFDASSYQATIDALGKLGRRVGSERRAEQIMKLLVEARAAATQTAPPGRRALFVLDRAPLVLAGSGSLADDLLRICGLENAAASLGTPYPRPATETLLALNPDFIFDASMIAGPNPTAAALHWWQRLAPTLPAVRDARVIALDPDLVNRAGPRLADGLAALSSAIQPPPTSNQ